MIFQFSKIHSLDVFWVRPVLVDKEEPNDGDGDTSFAGIYDTLSVPALLWEKAKSKVELYGLVLNRTNASWPTEGVGDEDRYTLGARLTTNPKPFDLDAEADYQFGRFGSGDISAWALAAEAGYTFARAAFAPRPFLGVDLASGDRHSNDGELNTFNQLFPTGHPHLGYIDAVGRQNIIDLRGGVEVTPLENRPWAKKAAVRTEYHMFWRQRDGDALYNSGGAPYRGTGPLAAGADSGRIGEELDLLLNWQIDHHAAAYFGYSHFVAGEFIAETGPSGDIDFVYAALTYTF